MTRITLDFEEGHIAPDLEPDIDDLGSVNVVIASRREGSTATDSDTTGPLGTEAIGIYRTQVDINPATDDVLPQHAHYHLVLGTDPDPRYPQVSVDLTEQSDSFTTDVSSIDVGDVLTLDSLPEDLGQPRTDLIVLGYTEVIGSHTRRITFNTRPGAILSHVGMLDGDETACLQTAGAHSSSITAEAVLFNVATDSGPIFTTSPPAGAQILVGGKEVMTVTQITGASSPQTFRVTRDPDQRMVHPNLSSVQVYRPLRLTL